VLYRKDTIIIECPTVGTIRIMSIWHDNSGPNPNWYLNKIVVVDLKMDRVYEFPCYNWLDDNKFARELFAGPPSAVVSVWFFTFPATFR